MRHSTILAVAGPLFSTMLAACATRSAPAPVPDSARVRADVEYLASDALEGRGTGTAGHDSASAYVVRRYTALGLRPALPGYVQRFTARSAVQAHSGTAAPAGRPTQNVVALVPGTDPRLSGQVIVVGAHLDHLGRSTTGALDPDAIDAIRNGADDNASGSAAVLEMARLVSARPARRTIVFVNFSGEELGLLGSQYFVEHPPVPLDSMVAMLNFDMVGRLRGDSVIVYGTGNALEMNAVVDSANAPLGMHLSRVPDGMGPSDQTSFLARKIPSLHFFTNLHDQYHRATDDAPLIHAAGIARIVTLADRVLREIDRRDARLTFNQPPAAQRAAVSRTNTGVYLGSIPDMAAPDIKGLRLTGVRAGSPADSAGLKAGDVIVEFAGREVTDIQTYSDALYSHSPGDEVTIVVLRGTERVTLKVRLGRRGG